jgi:hypothetical protein
MMKINSNGTSELDSLIESLLSFAKIASPSGEIDYTEESLDDLRKLREVKPVWSLELADLENFESTRTDNIIGGRPFTTEISPWLVDDEGNPLYPLIQLNLEQISNLTGNDFGTGLLQVWINYRHGDSWMNDVVRIIDTDEMKAFPTAVEFNSSEINPGGEFSEGYAISFNSLGYMCTNWEGWQLVCNSDRSFSKEEEEIIQKIEAITSKNSYRTLRKDWLLGFPDMGSGTPAGSYTPEPQNFIQFATPQSFNPVYIGRLGNIFYDGKGENANFWFDWNG